MKIDHFAEFRRVSIENPRDARDSVTEPENPKETKSFSHAATVTRPSRDHVTRVTKLLEEADREPTALPSPLIDIADAIAAVPRSPFLNDLALSRAAATFIVAERAAEAAPPALRADLHRLTVDSFKRTASEIRQAHYKTAYHVLDALADKIRGMRAH
jgi:hypothetical protein